VYELEDPDEIAAFYEQGSDRAVAVVCTAIVENRLTFLLKAAMRQDSAVHNELFRSSGPIGSLGSKIRLAYMLRLIHEDVYRDLLLITKIRNEFAHNVAITSFDEPSIKSRIESLHALGVWKSVEEKAKENLERNPDDFNKRVQTQILRNELSNWRDSFKMCLRLYIWKLVTSAKGFHEREPARFEPTAE
jgi:DNA-binding MltR family transcriptional regulator